MSMYAVLTSLFPPPRFMTMPNVGVDVSDASIKYITFKRPRRGRGNAALGAWGDIPLADGVVVDGRVQDPAQLAEQLRKVREKSGMRYVRLALPEKNAYIFETMVKADTSPSEIRGLLEFKLQENVPLSPRESFFDYEVVEQDPSDGFIQVVVTVYAKEIVMRYYEACVAAGLTPIAFEVEAQAIARAVTDTDLHSSSLIVDFGERHTGIGIVHGGTLVHTSTMDIGGRTLSAALREILGDCKESELTAIKNTHGLHGTHTNPEVKAALLRVVDKISSEIGARIEYWNTEEHAHEHRSVAEIILCGGSANLAGLPEYLTGSLALPVKRAAVWQHAFSMDEFVPPISVRHSYGYATAIGLALTDFMQPTS